MKSVKCDWDELEWWRERGVASCRGGACGGGRCEAKQGLVRRRGQERGGGAYGEGEGGEEQRLVGSTRVGGREGTEGDEEGREPRGGLCVG